MCESSEVLQNLRAGKDFKGYELEDGHHDKGQTVKKFRESGVY